MRTVEAVSTATIGQSKSIAVGARGGPRTTAFNLGAGDKGSFVSCSGTFPITITANAVTLGSTWNMALGNVGTTGYQTLSMADKSLIDGLPSLRIYPGENFELVSDGAKVYTQGRQRVLILLATTNITAATFTVDNEIGFDDLEFNRFQLELRGMVTQGAQTSGASAYIKRNGVYQTVNYYGTYIGNSNGYQSTPTDTARIPLTYNSSYETDGLIDLINPQALGPANVKIFSRMLTGIDSSVSMGHSGSGAIQGIRCQPASYPWVTGTTKLYGFRG